MAERAIACEARAAFDSAIQDRRERRERRREGGRRRPVDRDHRAYRPRPLRAGVRSRCSPLRPPPRADRRRRRASCRRRDCARARSAASRRISSPRSRSLAEPSNSTRAARLRERARDRGEARCRPALRRSVLRSRHQRDERLAAEPVLTRKRARFASSRRRARAPFGGQRARRLRICVEAERDEAFDGLIEPHAIELAYVVQQTVTPLAAKARALRNSREPGHQRGLERARQHDRFVVALRAQAHAERAAEPQLELAVARRELDRSRDLGHPREQRQRPRRREDVDLRSRDARREHAIERLRHHHVADPGRADDEHLGACAHGRRGARRDNSRCRRARP